MSGQRPVRMSASPASLLAPLLLVLLAACGGGAAPLDGLRLDSITPERGSMLGGTQVTITGEGIFAADGGGFAGDLSIEVCGEPLTDLQVAGELQSILLPGGNSTTVLIGASATGITAASSEPGADVMVVLPNGERQVLEGVFECYDPTPLISGFAASESSISRTQSVEFSWAASDPEGEDLECVLDPGDGSGELAPANCTAGTLRHSYQDAGEFTALLEVTNETGVSASARTVVSVDSGVAPQARGDELQVDQRGELTANVLSDNGSGEDELGVPSATVVSFGSGDAGGAVEDNPAGASVVLPWGTLTVASDGQLTLSDPGTLGNYTFHYRIANEIGTSDASVTIEVVTPPASSRNSTVEVDQAQLTADGASSALVTVQLKDADGFDLEESAGQVVINSTGGSVSAVSDHGDGSYSATLTAPTTAGNATVSAQLEGATLDQTATVQFVAGPAASLALDSGDGATLAVGSDHTLSVRVDDAFGNPVEGHPVDWLVTGGGGSFAQAISHTGSDGIAEGTWTLGTSPGAQSASAAATGLSGSPVQFAVTAQAGAASELSIETQPSEQVQNDVAFPRQPVAQLRDSFGNEVAKAGVEVTATIASGGGTLTGAAVVSTDAAGRAIFADLAIAGTVGTRTLRFDASGLSGVTSTDVEVVAGPAAQLVKLSGDGQSAVAGTSVS